MHRQEALLWVLFSCSLCLCSAWLHHAVVPASLRGSRPGLKLQASRRSVPSPCMSMRSQNVDRRALLLRIAALAPLILGQERSVFAKPTGDEPNDMFGRLSPQIRQKVVADIKIPVSAIPDEFEPLRQDIVAMIKSDINIGPTMVRVAFHTSGTYDKFKKTGGSSKGTLRFEEELKHEANAGIKEALVKLEPLKAKYPKVSYADLYTLVGAVAVEALGGPHIAWKGGRKDSMDPKDAAKDGTLPDADKGSPEKTMKHLRDIFGRMGFNDQEIVALSGAHTLGMCHLKYTGYEGFWSEVPWRFDNAYYNILLQPTPTPTEGDGWEVNKKYEKLQYVDSLGVYLMLPSDLALIQDPKTREWVELYAANSPRFFEDFAAVFSKLLALGTDQQK